MKIKTRTALFISIFILCCVFVIVELKLHYEYQYVQGELLYGECFVVISQSDVSIVPRDLGLVTTNTALYAYSISDGCTAMYSSCEKLYRGMSFTCVLDWNTCRCNNR